MLVSSVFFIQRNFVLGDHIFLEGDEYFRQLHEGAELLSFFFIKSEEGPKFYLISLPLAVFT